MKPTRKTLVKLAAVAEILDEAGMFADADMVDEFIKQATNEPDIQKVAGMWANFVSRLGGWARQLLFREYRGLYRKAKTAQEELKKEATAYLRQAQDWVSTTKELKKTLKRHQMQEWHKGVSSILSGMKVDTAPVLGPYDEQYGELIKRVLKIAPKELPQRQPPRPSDATLAPEAPEASPEAPAPEEPETAPEEAAPVPEATPPAVPEAPPEAAPPAAEPPPPPPVAEEPAIPAEEPVAEEPVAEEPVTEEPVTEEPTETPEAAPPAAPQEELEAPEGWRYEVLGKSKSRRDPAGHKWQWLVSDDNNRIRIPKKDLEDVSTGRGKILRGGAEGEENKYRPTGPANLTLRRLMGYTYWAAEADPDDPDMTILTRTDEEVPAPISLPHRRAPVEQAEKLKGLRDESALRINRIVAIGMEGLEGKSDEERLADAAAELFGRMESELEQ